MSRWEELASDKALVCRREINCDQGGAVVHMVLLADGFLIDCGSSGYGEKRAQILAEIINEVGPSRLSREGMRP
ncbi:hypothetical protein [Sphingomonas sanxanigenens]|nr:hypothetical protein [Sphingomonas sanxanigenens]